MRVAVVAHNERRVGGTEAYVAAIVPALARAGFDVATWFETADGPGGPVLPAGGAGPSWTARGDAPGDLRALAAWHPDILFVHGLQSLSTEQALIEIAPAVAFAHSYYGTCISGTKCHSFPNRTPCDKRFGFACLAQFYPRRCGGLSPVTMVGQFQLQRGRLRALASYARILVASRHMAREYERHGLGGTVRVVGLPAPLPTTTADSGPPADVRRLLYLGRLEAIKGVPLLLESAALIAAAVPHPIVLEIAGGGSLRVRLQADAARLTAVHRNLTISFHGQLPWEDSERLIAASHLLLVPSCWPEPFGLVGLEAATYGVPAVAFDVGGIRDWLVDRRTGVLVEARPPDAERFAEAVIRCLADPVALRTMGERAREHAREFAIDRHVQRVVDVFADVVAEDRRAERR